jgi:ABC-type methionine transport system permease subunit
MGIGGNGNFPPSMVTSAFGRKDFPVAYSVVNTIVGVVRSMAFILLAIILGKFGGKFEVAYWIFAIIALMEAALIATLKIKASSEPLTVKSNS